MHTSIIGWGHCLPDSVLLNNDLPNILETNNEWIISRTGIKQRHIAAPAETTRTLATQAAVNALNNAGLTANDVDAIIVATTTPEKTFPATAVEVQHDLNMTQGFAFDLQAVCSGFVYALATADAFIKARQARTIIIIGAETMSRLVDWTDRRTCILFGDGAGALIVQATDQPNRGILGTHLYSDGQFAGLLHVNSGPSSNQKTGTIEMNGKEVFRHAVQKMSQSIEKIVSEHHLTLADIDWFVPHQANKRILEAIAEKLHLPAEKIICTVSEHANTSAASIPLALSQYAEQGKIKPGQLVLCTALGGGFTWGASLIRW